MSKYLYLIDSGHGGNKADGSYVTAPAKMFEHSPSEIFYEGVFNRQIKTLLLGMLWDKNIDNCVWGFDECFVWSGIVSFI